MKASLVYAGLMGWVLALDASGAAAAPTGQLVTCRVLQLHGGGIPTELVAEKTFRLSTDKWQNFEATLQADIGGNANRVAVNFRQISKVNENADPSGLSREGQLMIFTNRVVQNSAGKDVHMETTNGRYGLPALLVVDSGGFGGADAQTPGPDWNGVALRIECQEKD